MLKFAWIATLAWTATPACDPGPAQQGGNTRPPVETEWQRSDRTTFAGRVVDESGAPIPGAELILAPAWRFLDSGDDGGIEFSLLNEQVEESMLFVYAEGYTLARVRVEPLLRNGFKISLGQDAPVSAQLVDAAGVGVPGVEVIAAPSFDGVRESRESLWLAAVLSEESGFGLDRGITDERGFYSLPGLSPGLMQLSAFRDGEQVAWNSSASADTEWGEGGFVPTGKLSFASPTPKAGRVTLTPYRCEYVGAPRPFTELSQTLEYEAGTAQLALQLPKLWGNAWWLRVEADGYAPDWIQLGSYDPELQIQLSPPLDQELQLVDAQGLAIPGAQVVHLGGHRTSERFLRRSLPRGSQAMPTTDANGKVHFPLAPSVAGSVAVWTPYTAYPIEVQVEPSGRIQLPGQHVGLRNQGVIQLRWPESNLRPDPTQQSRGISLLALDGDGNTVASWAVFPQVGGDYQHWLGGHPWDPRSRVLQRDSTDLSVELLPGEYRLARSAESSHPTVVGALEVPPRQDGPFRVEIVLD